MTVAAQISSVVQASRPRPSQAFVRALLAEARSDRSTPSEKIARELWPRDEQVQTVLKAASAPATTTTAGWASQLAASTNADVLLTTGPASAGGELLRRGTVLDFGTSAQINVPGLVAAGSDFSWVLQGNPIPVRQLSITNGAQLTPKKMAVAFAATRELVNHSVPNAEQLLRQILTATVSAGLDNVLLDATAASGTRPAGLRNGIAALGAAAGGGDAALMKDLAAITAAVAGVGGMEIAFVACPGEAAKIALRAGSEFKFPVLASSALAAGVVMAVALPALVAAIDPAVRFEVGQHALMHFEDTTPLAIGTAGSPPTVAAPALSMWQADLIAFRFVLEACWGLRSANAVAWVSAVTW